MTAWSGSRRIYTYVTNEISYVGLEFGEHRFRPFSADWVLTHGIGDCKDTAALLVALFEAVDIPARMAMVRTADLGPIVGEMAMLEVFNHAIAYLPEDDLWLDGTASGHAMLPPPGMDQGAMVLVVDGDDSRPQNHPTGRWRTAQDHLPSRRRPNGMVPLKVRVEDSGEAADRRRGSIRRQQGSATVRDLAAAVVPGGRTDRGSRNIVWFPRATRPSSSSRRWCREPRSRAAEGSPPIRESLICATRVVPTGDRSGPLLVEVRPDLEWTLEVELGRPPATMPTATTLTGDFGSLKLEPSSSRRQGYRVEGYVHLEPGLIDARRAPELREFLLEVERILSRPLETP